MQILQKLNDFGHSFSMWLPYKNIIDEPIWLQYTYAWKQHKKSIIYLYLKLAKMLFFSYYLLCFLFNKSREQEGGTGSARNRGVAVEVAQIMYTHASKYKNDKIKI
jgi:hypothetical protein